MTRRRDRNRDSRRALAETHAAGYRCPDCAATTQLTEAAAGVFELTVAHDATCPTLARLEAHR